MRFTDTFGYDYAVVVFRIVFHILFGIRENADKPIVRLANGVLYTFNDRIGINVKFAVTPRIYFYEGLCLY